jgi:hypothetical protein
MAFIVGGSTLAAVTDTSGTWTPGLQVGSTDNNRTAKYIKVGKMVFCRCSFYTSGTASYRSGTTLRLTGLPFTAASGNTFAGQGHSKGPSNVQGLVMVEAGASTCVFVSSGKDPSKNIDLTNGAQARRESLDDAQDNHYNLFFTYVSAT